MSSNGEQMADGTMRQEDDAPERGSTTKAGTEAKTQVENGLEATRIQTDTGKIGGHSKDNPVEQSFFPRNEEGKGSQKIDLEVLPARLGRYLLLDRIGAGSVGVVYEGLDRNNNKSVAVKVMQDKSVQFSDADNADWVQQRRRFFDEARACGRMRHRNILQIMDMGIEQGLCYIVTELVPKATTVGDLLATQKRFSARQAATLIHHLAGALDHMHQRRVVHLDIKPENILLPESNLISDLKLADFGIAHMAQTSGADNKPSEILGSPRYMSPEQLQGHEITPASDFFSLGVMAYEVLAGQHPFRASNIQSLCRKIISADPAIALIDINPDIPPMLLEVVNSCMSKDPAKRPASGRQIVEKLAPELFGLGEYDGGTSSTSNLVDSMRNLDFFSEFDGEELDQIADICLIDEYSPGGDIIEEGTINDSFFVIINGDVLVRQGDTELGRLKAGHCFGEMGYLTSIKRTATVLAVRKTTVIKFNVDLVSQLPQSTQLKFSRSFIRLLVNRLAQTTRQLTST